MGIFFPAKMTLKMNRDFEARVEHPDQTKYESPLVKSHTGYSAQVVNVNLFFRYEMTFKENFTSAYKKLWATPGVHAKEYDNPPIKLDLM